MPNPQYRQQEESISVALTHDILDPLSIMAEVKSPKAGAIVLFAGRLSTHLQPPLLLRATRYHTRQLRRKARHTSRVYLLSATGSPNHDFNRP